MKYTRVLCPPAMAIDFGSLTSIPLRNKHSQVTSKGATKGQIKS